MKLALILALIFLSVIIGTQLLSQRRKAPQKTSDVEETRTSAVQESKAKRMFYWLPSTNWKWLLTSVVMLFIGIMTWGYLTYPDDDSFIGQLSIRAGEYFFGISPESNFTDHLDYKQYPFCSQEWDEKAGKGVGDVIHEGTGQLRRKTPDTLWVTLQDKDTSKYYCRTYYKYDDTNGEQVTSWNRDIWCQNSPPCMSGFWKWSDTAELTPDDVSNRKLNGVYSCTFDSPKLRGHMRHFWLNTEWNYGEEYCTRPWKQS